jgi:hypothetical protein
MNGMITMNVRDCEHSLNLLEIRKDLESGSVLSRKYLYGTCAIVTPSNDRHK